MHNIGRLYRCGDSTPADFGGAYGAYAEFGWKVPPSARAGLRQTRIRKQCSQSFEIADRDQRAVTRLRRHAEEGERADVQGCGYTGFDGAGLS
jgi:hypothetical protein